MHFDSPLFLVFLSLFIFCWRRLKGTDAAGYLLAVGNLLVLARYATSLDELLPMGVLLLAGYGVLQFCDRIRSRGLFGLLLVLLVGAFVWIKGYAFVGWLGADLEQSFLVVGLSYSFFRMLHLCVDCWRSKWKTGPNLSEYLQYVLFFPALLSGPIHRWPEFRADILGAAQPEELQFDALARFARGYFKVYVLGEVAWRVQQLLLGLIPSSHSVGGGEAALVFGGAMACYAVYLYFNFSGYMDIILPISAAMGIRLPENFDRPFAAENFLLFWRRWHMTLSFWFRDYVYIPLGGSRGSSFVLYRNLLISFMLSGVWHGTSWSFLIFGLVLAVGASGNRFYQSVLMRQLGEERYTKLSRSVWYRQFCRALTFTYFACSLSTFWLDVHGLKQAWLSWWGTWCVSFGGVIVLYLLLYVPVRTCATFWGSKNRPWQVAFMLFVASLVMMLSSSRGTMFVYGGF